jgi:glycosyl transferase family 11
VITVKLRGGLGNQLFQFALGRSLAVRRDTDLSFDLRWFGNELPGETPRMYALEPYELNASLDGASHPSSRPDPKTRIGRFLARRDPLLVKQRGQDYDQSVLDAPDGSLLDGYWQSEKYFLEIATRVREELTLPNSPDAVNADLLSRIDSPRSVGVHIRRGDYVTNLHAQAFHGLPGVEWYRLAVDLIATQAGGIELFVFSDDPDWSEAELRPDHPTTYVRHNGPAAHEDLRLLSACSHHVLSNSSFSWWGAWLGEKPDQLAVAPSPWFRRAPAATRDVVPARWITLPMDASSLEPQALT